jgi:hypothetical protein
VEEGKERNQTKLVRVKGGRLSEGWCKNIAQGVKKELEETALE